MATLQEQVTALAQQVTQKDEMINILKIKTRDFVQNLKDEHATALRGLEGQLAALSEERNNKDVENAQRLDELRAELNVRCLEVQKFQAAVTEKDQRIESLTTALTEHKRFHAKELEETQLKHEQLTAEQDARVAALAEELAALQLSHKNTTEPAGLPAVQADVSEFLRKIESLETENRHLISDCAAQRCLADELTQQLAAVTAAQSQPQTSPGAEARHNHDQQLDEFASQLAQKYQEIADITNQLDAQKVQTEESQRALAAAERALSSQTVAHEAATEQLQQQVLQHQADVQKLTSEMGTQSSEMASLQASLEAVQRDAEVQAAALRERLIEQEGLVVQLQAQLASTTDVAQRKDEALGALRSELGVAHSRILELEAQCQAAIVSAAQADNDRAAQAEAAQQGLASEVQAELTQERLLSAQLKASLEKYEAQILDLSTQLSSSMSSGEAAQQQLKQSQAELATLQASVEKYAAQIFDLTTQLSSTTASGEAAQEQLQKIAAEASQLRQRLAEHEGLVAQLQAREDALSSLRTELDATNGRISELEAQCQAATEAAAQAGREKQTGAVQAELTQERMLSAQLKTSVEKYETQISDLSTQLSTSTASGEAALVRVQQSQVELATLQASVEKYEAQISDLTTRLSSTTANQEEQLKQATAEASQLRERLAEQEGLVAQLQAQLATAADVAQAKEEALCAFRTELDVANDRISELEAQCQAANDAAAQADRDRAVQVQATEQGLASEVAAVQAELAQERSLCEQLKASLEKTQLDVDRLTEAEGQLRCALQSAEVAKSESMAELESTLRDEIRFLKAQRTQEQDQLAQNQLGLATLQASVEKYEAQISELTTQLSSTVTKGEAAQEQLQQSQAELATLQASVVRYEAQISDLTTQLSSTAASGESAQEQLQQSQVQLATLQASVEKYEAQISDLTTQLSSIAASGGSAQEQLQRLTIEASQLRERLAEHERLVTQLQAQLATKQAEVSQLTAQITSQQADLDSVLGQLTEKVDLLDAANKAAKSSEEKLEVLKKNHNAWKEEALRHTKDLDQQVEQLSAQRTAIAAERDAAVLQATNEKRDLAQLTAHLQTLEEEGVRRSGEGQGEIIVLKNEIEARTQQIAVLSAEKADWLVKQQHLENERLSLASQRDDLQLHLEDVMQSLTTKDETISKMSRSSEDRERTLRTQLSELQSKSKQRVGDLVGQVEQLQAEVSKRMLEVEGLTESLSQLTRTSDENKASLVAAKAQLETERTQNQERKLKVRAYLDNLSKENKALQEAHATMQATAKDAVAAKNYMEQHRNQLEAALHSAKEQAAKELDARSKEWIQLENGYHSQLGEKDAEIRHLLLQVELASQSNVEEVTATRQLIQESMREMEAHKAKRLAARSEMINLAKTLERAQSDGDEVKAQLQFVLSPIVTEQIARLESLVRDVEKVSFHLTSGKETTALTASTSSRGGHSSLTLRQETANPMNAPKTPDKGSKSSRNLIEFTPQGVPIAPSHDSDNFSNHSVEAVVPRSKHDFNSITDALVQVEVLRQELERVQMGLALMTFSVEKLMDIVTAEPVCCAGFFDFFVPRTHQAIGRDSTGPFTTSQSSVGQYSNGATSRQSSTAGPANSTGSRLGRVSNIVAAGASAIPFQNRKIQQAGYKNINTNPNAFSIECTDDDDEM